MRRFNRPAIALAALVVPGSAQDVLEIDQSKLYLSSPEACAAAEAGDVPADFANLRFDAGVQFSEEAFCTFYDIKDTAQQSELLATAICDFGGSMFVDLLILQPVDEETLRIISTRDQINMLVADSGEENNPDELLPTFTRCAVDDLPRD